ncbi:hypothetical protein [Glycomyces tarimensis]
MDTPKLHVKRLTRLLGAATSGLLIAGAIAACGGEDGGGGEATTAAETTSEAPATQPESTEPTESEETDMPSETPHLDPSMGSDKPGSTAEMTITGKIESGVESGCLIMRYDGKVYGIFGEYDDSVVYAGAEVTLHGRLDPEMMSFCQQGTPFVVEEAESAG